MEAPQKKIKKLKEIMTHQTKLGKFYPMTPETSKKLRAAKLTAAEWRIWSYLVEQDPFGERYIDLETLDVMQECECSKATFYRAISKFQKLQLFDFQDKGWSFKNEVGISQLKAQKSSLKNETKNLKNKMKGFSNETKNLKNETRCAKMKRPKPENLAGQGFGILKTNNTLKKINTLSEGEREKFKNFCKRRADEMPEKIVLLDSWIEAHFEELHQMWQEASGKGDSSAALASGQKKDSAASQGQNSRNSEIHPSIAKGLKDGTLLEYDRYIKMVKIKGERFWTHEKDYLAMQKQELEGLE